MISFFISVPPVWPLTDQSVLDKLNLTLRSIADQTDKRYDVSVVCGADLKKSSFAYDNDKLNFYTVDLNFFEKYINLKSTKDYNSIKLDELSVTIGLFNLYSLACYRFRNQYVGHYVCFLSPGTLVANNFVDSVINKISDFYDVISIDCSFVLQQEDSLTFRKIREDFPKYTTYSSLYSFSYLYKTFKLSRLNQTSNPLDLLLSSSSITTMSNTLGLGLFPENKLEHSSSSKHVLKDPLFLSYLGNTNIKTFLTQLRPNKDSGIAVDPETIPHFDKNLIDDFVKLTLN